jgi:periplasmic copper chaperone A
MISLKQIIQLMTLCLGLGGLQNTVAAHEIKYKNLTIIHPWSRQSPAHPDQAAGYMVSKNAGAEDDTLLSATSEVAAMVHFADVAVDGGGAKMTAVPGGIVIPAGASVELRPRHMHVMFEGVHDYPPVDTMFKATLTFAKAGPVDIEFDVTEPDAGME